MLSTTSSASAPPSLPNSARPALFPLGFWPLLLRKIRLVKSHEVTTKLARAGNNHTSATATNRTPTQVMARGHDAVPMFQSNFVAVTAALSEALRTLGRIAAKAASGHAIWTRLAPIAFATLAVSPSGAQHPPSASDPRQNTIRQRYDLETFWRVPKPCPEWRLHAEGHLAVGDGQTSHYGVGAVADARGEITIYNGKPT